MARKLKNTNSIKEYNIEQLENDFIKDCKIRGLSDVTIRGYKTNIGYFKKYLEKTGIKLSDLSYDSIKEYNIYLMNNTNRNVTSINTLLRHLSTFLKYGYENSYILEPLKVRYLKPYQEPKRIYTDDEIKKLLEKPNINSCSYATFRNYCIIMMLITTGMRRTSLINIKLDDVDYQQNVIRLTHTKNKQVHYVSMTNSLKSCLKEWLKFRVANNNDYLFTTQEGTQLKASSLTNSIYCYCKSKGIGTTSIHSFRHYYSIKYMQQGGNIFMLSKLLGHSNIGVTENYLKSLDKISYVKNNSFDIFDTIGE